jgi:lipid A 3-O-deacylase
MKLRLFTFFLFTTFWGHTQMIDNAASYRNIGSNRYFRLHYENDYFSETDLYYTQGINLEFVHPVLAKSPLAYLLVRSSTKEMKYGMSVEHLGYTPTSIYHDEILTNDRPFAAVLFLKTFAIVNDSIHLQRVVSAISTGIIGPGACGYEMQTSIHQAIGGVLPHGWNNQIQNDFVFNYQLDYEKGILSVPNFLLVSCKVGAKLGTLNDKLYGGAVLMLGLFENPFQHFATQKRAFQVYLYAEPLCNLVGYDASLQGGLLNRNSVYTISGNDINRIVLQGNAGIVFKIKRLNLEYFQSYLAKEFETGTSHHWGGVRIGWMF